MADANEPPADGLWLPIAEIARIKGQARQTVAEKVSRLEADDKLQTRPGDRGTKLVNLAQYDLAIGDVGDPAREMGAASRCDDDDATSSGDASFRDAAAREKRYKADLAEIEVRTKLRELVDVSQLGLAVSTAAETIVAVIERVPQSADIIAAAVGKDGPAGARAALKKIVRQQRVAIADALRKLVADINGDDAARSARIAEPESVLLWGDLDPDE